MRDRIVGAMVFGVALTSAPAWAQMHKVAKPQQVVRAVGVYEWTGDMAKPTASRLIPVSLYINSEFQDAGVYMAQPVPFALETGNVYELKEAGADRGTVDLEYARHLQTANGDYNDGWFGYGSFKAPVVQAPKVAKKATPARTSGIESSVKDTADSDRPTLVRKPGSESTSGSTGDSGTTTTASTGGAPADDPDRPTMKRPASDTGSGNSTSAGSGNTGSTPASPESTTASSGNVSSGSAPADDPDRPTLKRRTPEEAKKAKEEATASATGMVAALNDDPNRPKLHFGKPAGVTTGADLPKLVGMPANLHQMAAVSDAVDRDPHEFARPWSDGAERAAILQKMEALARTKLTAYERETTPATIEPAAKTTATSRSRRKATASAPPEALMDEELKGYTLSYGGDPTYVFMAHTAGTGAALRYVTVVAQTDETGEVKPVIQSVTDAAHLDRTAQMRFVDAVDADASNRASLLFELREHSTRQFALYRVIAGHSQQIFLSGPRSRRQARGIMRRTWIRQKTYLVQVRAIGGRCQLSLR